MHRRAMQQQQQYLLGTIDAALMPQKRIGAYQALEALIAECIEHGRLVGHIECIEQQAQTAAPPVSSNPA